MPLLITILNNILLHSEAHGGFWEEFLAVALDPAHILAEIVFTIVFDGLFIALVWGVLFKKIILPRLRKQIHEDIDKEHGIESHVQ